MVLNWTLDSFTEVEGLYYSPPFLQDLMDTNITVGVTLSVTGNTSLQISINEVDWSDVADSSFVCDTFALQTYCNGQQGLTYRIVTDQEPISAQILI